MAKKDDINVKHSRFRDAIWYGVPKSIIIGGAGNIGSYVALFLSRIGFGLTIYDPDGYEEINLSGQCCKVSDIGKPKVSALKDTLIEFSGRQIAISPFQEKYTEESMVTPIMISGFDNMASRKVMFEKWCQAEDRELFIDGRTSGAEGFEVYFITKGREDSYKATLFEDNEIANVACSYKATSHIGGMIGTIITTGVTNFIANEKYGAEIRILPFKMEFIAETFSLTSS